MAGQDFFPQRPEVKPKIYAYEHIGVEAHMGYIKVGYTTKEVSERVREIEHTSQTPYRILSSWDAIRNDGTVFKDYIVHAVLRKRGIKTYHEGKDKNEWFKCKIEDVGAAVLAVKNRIENFENRDLDFKMRSEQIDAVEKTISYFNAIKKDEPDRPPKFLWNAKMRFGKTFASYQLAKRMGFRRILILTFKPAVESAWADDLKHHLDFEGWQFISNKDASFQYMSIDQLFERADKERPIVVFGSFQDLLGSNENGGIKAKNEFIHTTNWDLVIFDEYHYGAWRDNAKKLFDLSTEEEYLDFNQEEYKRKEADNAFNETFLPITADHYLFLSGTPFRALNSGEFIEEQIYNWTYTDEQREKEKWVGDHNPYECLPRMVMMTYQMPEEIKQVALGGEFNEFDLNVFFSARVNKGDKIENARFVYESEVAKWVSLIRGSYLPSNLDDLKLGREKRPPMPFSDSRLLKVLNHTLWFLPNVASCYAMYNLLSEDNFFREDYKIIVAAGPKAGIGLDVLNLVENEIDDPLRTKTITLSCGKLTTGVTVRPWSGVFMLRNLNSPETYFQTAFRVQSPWIIPDDEGNDIIMKRECYVFDFALDRALREISDYSCRLDIKEDNPEKKVQDFIKFLPVLAYDGSSMRQVSAQDILDITFSGTSATLLARRWESALLVNVDNATLSRLINDKEALNALMRIEGFRALNDDIETIIKRSDVVKRLKSKDEGKLTSEEKKELTDAEKEYKSLRKQIQEKLIKFATRVPVFMYLTDYRERSLKEVITDLDSDLFKMVTGLEKSDFERLCTIGVFNANLMNDAIYKFRRYEDSSLTYTGIDKHEGENVGGWDIEIKSSEYEKLFYNQQSLFSEVGSEISEEKSKNDATAENIENGSSNEFSYPSSTFKDESMAVASDESRKYGEGDVNQDVSMDSETDLSAVKVGLSVEHKVFGTGKVVQLGDGRIRVRFNQGEKTFLFPQAFNEDFLFLN